MAQEDHDDPDAVPMTLEQAVARNGQLQADLAQADRAALARAVSFGTTVAQMLLLVAQVDHLKSLLRRVIESGAPANCPSGAKHPFRIEIEEAVK